MSQTIPVAVPASPIVYRENSLSDAVYTIRDWTKFQKIIFRFAFIFFLVMILPIDWKFYRQLFSVHWAHLHFAELLGLTRYMPQIFSSESIPQYGPGSYADWGVIILISAIGALIWSRYD